MSRKDDISSFKVVDIGLPPLCYNLPVRDIRRVDLGYELSERGIGIPDYLTFRRENLRREDLVVFAETWWIVFRYKGKMYNLVIKPGAVIDYASVPRMIAHGKLSKRGQHVDEAAVLHDALFALKLMSYEDANNCFVGMLNWTGLCNKLQIGLYSFGVNTRVGRRIYESGDPDTHWLKDYVEFKEIV